MPSGNIFWLDGGSVFSIEPTYAFRIHPSRVLLSPGERTRFTVATGDSDGVTWASSQGTILPDGTFECPESGGVLITGRSKTGEISYAWVEQPYQPLSVDAWVDSGSGNGRAQNPFVLTTGGTANLKAKLKNHPNQGFAWAVEEGPVGGSIASGVYTAPSQAGTYHVVATSLFDSRYSARLTMVVASPLVVDPTLARVAPSGALRLWAIAAGGTGTVSWVSSGGSEVVHVGRLDPTTYIYDDPYTFEWTAPATPGVYTLTASWTGHPESAKVVTVSVVQPTEAAIFVKPSLSYVRPYGAINWLVVGTAAVDPLGNYSGIGPLRGTLIGPMESPTPSVIDLGAQGYSGGITAPAQPGSYRLLLVQQQTPGLTAEASVRVMDSPVILDFKMDPPLVLDGKSYTLTWTGANADSASLDGQSQSALVGSLTLVGSNWGTNLMGENFQKTHVLTLSRLNSPIGHPSYDQRSLVAIRGKLTLTGPAPAQQIFPGGTIQVPLTMQLLAGIYTEIPMLGSMYKLKLAVDWTASAGQILQTSSNEAITRVAGTTTSSYTLSPWVNWQAPLQPGDYTLTATSKDDPTIVCLIPVTVLSTGVGISISPTSAQIYTGASTQFTNAIYAPTTRVVWSCSFGSITQQGLFTAPSSPGTGTVTVTSVDDPTKSATALVTATISTVTIGITPTTATVYTGQSIGFGFTLAAPTNRTVWTCSAGTITQTGTYTAPPVPGTYTVTVTSVDDPSKFASATVVVIPPDITLGVLPAYSVLNPGQCMTFTSSIQITGGNDKSLLWSCDGGFLLEKGPYAFYTAPLIPGAYTVTVTSVANPAVLASATVQVSAQNPTTNQLGAIPISATLNPGQRVFLGSNFVVSDPQTGIDWTSTSGQLTPDSTGASAFYTAPNIAGAYTVTTQGRLHSELSTLVNLSINPPAAPGFSVMPLAASLSTGQSMLLEAMNAQGHIIPNPIWAVQEAQGGLISGAGMYSAPLSAGIYHVVATQSDDPSQTAVVTLTVLSGGGDGPGGVGVFTYPTTSELYDPDTGSFSVMDDLGYGLEEPKLALELDGTVFVSGIIQGSSAASPTLYKGTSGRQSLAALTTPLSTGVVMGEIAPKISIYTKRGDKQFWISSVPDMNDITPMVKIDGIDNKALATYKANWKFTVSYNQLGIKNTGPLTPRIFEGYSGGEGMSQNPQITFSSAGISVIIGGDLMITVDVLNPTGKIVASSTVSGYKISGKNPTSDTVMSWLTFPSSNTYGHSGMTLSAACLSDWMQCIAKRESWASALNQFTEIIHVDNKYRKLGEPTGSSDGGMGIMQITDGRMASDQRWRVLWDWRENLLTGIDTFNSKLTIADNYPDQLVNSPDIEFAITVLNAFRQRNNQLPLNIVYAPQFTATQLLRDGVRGYNGFGVGLKYSAPIFRIDNNRVLHEYRPQIINDDLLGTVLVTTNEKMTDAGLVADIVWELVPVSERSAGDPDYVNNVKKQNSNHPCGIE